MLRHTPRASMEERDQETHRKNNATDRGDRRTAGRPSTRNLAACIRKGFGRGLILVGSVLELPDLLAVLVETKSNFAHLSSLTRLVHFHDRQTMLIAGHKSIELCAQSGEAVAEFAPRRRDDLNNIFHRRTVVVDGLVRHEPPLCSRGRRDVHARRKELVGVI